ncbi:YdeI/OmpD-associated family protein [Fulvivirga ligni]|uniref:YdeI/OmpD-associated family protein n=1 Tax=Fulvivirga ligni TaxID=2904246 RepID=UPI001F175862|nr:YdeI/OmpD-associated family protein [Fulvivirga ligni]UII22268.1 YdeI/OmpD-associated family protein [Fulvivirga ligni]
MKFKAHIFQKGNNLGIEVPEEIIEKFGAGKKPPVSITLQGYTYQTTVGVMAGKYLIPLNSSHRKHVDVNGGENIEVDVQLDTAPREVEIPSALKGEFKNNKVAADFYENLSPSYKNKIATLIDSAKTDETRNKRVAKVMEDLSQGVKP